jgi:hypothetical protein
MSSLAFLLDCSFTLIYKPASLQHVTWRDSHTTFARNITWRSASGLLSLAQSCVDNYRPILRMRLGLVAASRHLGMRPGSPVPMLSLFSLWFYDVDTALPEAKSKFVLASSRPCLGAGACCCCTSQSLPYTSPHPVLPPPSLPCRYSSPPHRIARAVF